MVFALFALAKRIEPVKHFYCYPSRGYQVSATALKHSVTVATIIFGDYRNPEFHRPSYFHLEGSNVQGVN